MDQRCRGRQTSWECLVTFEDAVGSFLCGEKMARSDHAVINVVRPQVTRPALATPCPVHHHAAVSLSHDMPTTPIQATYLAIGVLALLPIYFGSFASLKVLSFPPCLALLRFPR